MKRVVLLSFVLCLVLFAQSYAQQAINEKAFGFQGYARNLDGSAVSSETISVKFSIYPEGNQGSPVFEETQSKQTDDFGIFTAEIGIVNNVVFRAIDFATNDLFLRVEVSIDGSNLIEISNTRLNSVPYAQASARSLLADVATSANNGVPPGTIIPFAGTQVPVGYIACDGRLLDPNDQANTSLFSAISFSWGGDGTNFRVPDLRGYFLRGVSNGTTVDPNALTRFSLHAGGNTGDKVGSYQIGELGRHEHAGNTSNDGNHTHPISVDESNGGHSGTITKGSNRGNSTGRFGATETSGAHIHSFITDQRGGDENRPVNAYVLYIIKL